MPTSYQLQVRAATQHLRRHDPVLARIIDRADSVGIEPHTDYFKALAGSIIGQQLSVAVARTIRSRFEALGTNTFPTPQQTLKYSDEQLRGIGLSAAKVKYMRDLAQHVVDKRLDLKRIAELPNEEIITELTDVKGIGEWTAHMFLIFCVGRLNVLPVGDLGIRKGIQLLYELPELPGPVEIQAIAERNSWTGYESIASWYVWRSLDLDVTI